MREPYPSARVYPGDRPLADSLVRQRRARHRHRADQRRDVEFSNACIAGSTQPGAACTTNVTIGLPTNDMLVPGVDVASVPKGYLGEPMFQHGFFAEIRGSEGAFGSRANFLQIHIQLERVFNLAPKWHLLLRDEAGDTVASHFAAMPPEMRFFAGGEGSVRGFAYNDLSPTQQYCPRTTEVCDLAKAGGKDVITGTVEFDRDLPRNFGIAAFFDYGNAFNHFGAQCDKVADASPPRQECHGLSNTAPALDFASACRS